MIPSTQQEGPTLRTLSTKARGRSGSGAVATKQACYDGALGDRATHSMQDYEMDSSDKAHENYTYSISSTYHDGTLKIHTTHYTPPAGSTSFPEYHMTLLDSYAMTSRPRNFRGSFDAFQNPRKSAEERRDEFMTTPNSRAMEPLAYTPADRQMASTSTSSSLIHASLSSQAALL